jgi:hypothetical protein
MTLALIAVGVVIVGLLWDLVLPAVVEAHKRRQARNRRVTDPLDFDPGRELRAEQRARELLRSCVDPEDWAMYRDLGFLRVWGRLADGPAREGREGAPYAYLVYPHKPIVAYLPQTLELLNEYCVEFPDMTKPYGSSRLPDSDDVLAKWMALTSDERRLVHEANMHLPGRQVDPRAVRRDLWRLQQWERRRLRQRGAVS